MTDLTETLFSISDPYFFFIYKMGTIRPKENAWTTPHRAETEDNTYQQQCA